MHENVYAEVQLLNWLIHCFNSIISSGVEKGLLSFSICVSHIDLSERKPVTISAIRILVTTKVVKNHTTSPLQSKCTDHGRLKKHMGQSEQPGSRISIIIPCQFVGFRNSFEIT